MNWYKDQTVKCLLVQCVYWWFLLHYNYYSRSTGFLSLEDHIMVLFCLLKEVKSCSFVGPCLKSSHLSIISWVLHAWLLRLLQYPRTGSAIPKPHKVGALYNMGHQTCVTTIYFLSKLSHTPDKNCKTESWKHSHNLIETNSIMTWPKQRSMTLLISNLCKGNWVTQICMLLQTQL